MSLSHHFCILSAIPHKAHSIPTQIGKDNRSPNRNPFIVRANSSRWRSAKFTPAHSIIIFFVPIPIFPPTRTRTRSRRGREKLYPHSHPQRRPNVPTLAEKMQRGYPVGRATAITQGRAAGYMYATTQRRAAEVSRGNGARTRNRHDAQQAKSAQHPEAH